MLSPSVRAKLDAAKTAVKKDGKDEVRQQGREQQELESPRRVTKERGRRRSLEKVVMRLGPNQDPLLHRLIRMEVAQVARPLVCAMTRAHACFTTCRRDGAWVPGNTRER